VPEDSVDVARTVGAQQGSSLGRWADSDPTYASGAAAPRSGRARFAVRARVARIAVEQPELEGRHVGDRGLGIAAQVGDCTQHQVAAIAELAERAVAVEAEESADPVGGVIMVDVLGGRLATDGTQAALFGEHLVEVLDGNAVPAT
jgi:hypothetical protein